MVFLQTHVPIVEKKNLPYNQEQRTWQEIRRYRYVEFNLVHDKGTLFGLQNQREELRVFWCLLPPHVEWVKWPSSSLG